MLGAFLLLLDYQAITPPLESSVIATPPQVRSTLRISNGGWGGDLVLSPSGDLQLSYDTADVPEATFERISRLINTSPRLFSDSGAPISAGDYPGQPNWGAGLPAEVDELSTSALALAIQQRILNGLSQDSSISPVPPPQVVVQVIDAATLRVSVNFRLTTGQPVAVNGYNLAVASRAGG